MKVWLDDMREAPPGWVRARTPEEVIELLRLGRVTELSLDHDLGLDSEESERTGYSVFLWLEVQVNAGSWGFVLPEISIHSANPVGRERMAKAIEAIHRADRATGANEAE